MDGSTGTFKRVSRAVGIRYSVYAGPLGGGGDGHHLRGSEYLAEALVLREVEGPFAAVVYVGNQDGPAVGANSLRRKGGILPG